MITTSDIWQTSSTNSNTINQSFYFPSSFDFNNSSNPNQYHTMENNNYDYQSLPDVSSSYLIDPYSHMFTNNYSIDPYSTSTAYNSTSMDYSSSGYISTTDSYQHAHPMYTNVPPVSSSLDIQPDYQSTTSQWDSAMIKMRSHDGMYVFYSIQKWMPTCLFFFLLLSVQKKTRERRCPFSSHISIEL